MSSWRGLPPRVLDVLLVLVVWAFEVLAASDVPSGSSTTVGATVAYAGVGAALLLWRRQYPVAVLVVALVHMVGVLVLLPHYRPLAITLVALYSVAVATGPIVALAVLVGMYAATAPLVLVDELSRPLAPEDTVAGVTRAILLAQAIALAACWGMGRWVRATRQASRLRDEIAEFERRDAVRAERLRIAREMHDVVSHAVTTMALHAAAARQLVTVDPTRAADSLERVENGGVEAVEELRTMLGVLRGDDPEGGAPIPGLGALGSMVEGVRRAGLGVRVERDGRVDPPAAVALVVVRVVQEALTNAVKHAGRGAEVVVSLTGTADAVRVHVRDDGGVRPLLPHPRSGGFGLSGLAERVEHAGGTFRAMARDGGFEVLADLPSVPSSPDRVPSGDQTCSPTG